MGDHSHRIGADWPAQLLSVLERGRAAGRNGLLVFDLDSTIFDNRPRQARIVREFGEQRGVKALTLCSVDDWTSGWDLRAALVACGLTVSEADGLLKDAKNFWAARFFTSEYCVDDVEVPGAAAYLKQVVKTGARLIYVTGRQEEMRPGSVECLRKCEMPLPDADAVQLLMKPTLRENDDVYKRETHAKLRAMGQVIAAFDNEPTHANDYALNFPEATVVHLATDHSGRPVELEPRIISVPHFSF